MEYFHKAKSVRLRSHHGKFLAAEPDEETVKQKSSGSGAETRWIVELVQGKPNLIRLKSSSSWKYLCAREETLLMVGGWSGKKVVQGSARLKSDPAVEWEPIKEGAGVTNHVKLRSAWKGTFLKGNGQMFWRNSVTHDDSPNSTATQDWILWVVDVLEFDHGNEMGLQQMKDKSGQGQGGAGSVQSQQQRPPPPSFTGVMRVMDSIKRQNSNSDDSPSTPPRSKPPPAAGGGEGIIAPIKSKWAQKPLPPPPASQVMESIEKQNNSKYKETPKKTPTPTPTPTPPPPMYDDNDNDNDNDNDDDDDDNDDGGGYKTETNTNTERRGSYSYYTPAAHQPQQSNQNHHQHQPSRFSQPAADDGLIYYYTPKQEEHIRPATTTRRNDYYSPKPADADIIMKNISYRNVLDDWQKIYDNHDFTDIHQLPVGVNNSSTSSSTHNKKNKINIIIIPFEVQKAKLTLKEIDHHLNFKEAYYQGQLKQIEKAISTLLSYQNNNNISTAKLKRYQVQILSLRTNHDAAFTTLDQYDTFSNKRSSMKAQIQEQANRARDLQASEQDRLNALALARDKRDDLLSQLRDLEQQIREAEIALKDNDITLQELCRSIQNNKDLYNSQIEKQQNNWLARKVEAHDMIKRVENDWDQIKLDLSLHMLVDDY